MAVSLLSVLNYFLFFFLLSLKRYIVYVSSSIHEIVSSRQFYFEEKANFQLNLIIFESVSQMFRFFPLFSVNALIRHENMISSNSIHVVHASAGMCARVCVQG